MSTAGTGFMYTTRRLRVAERLSLMKYDPVGTWFFFRSPAHGSQTTCPLQGSQREEVVALLPIYIYQSINLSINLYIYISRNSRKSPGRHA